MRSWLSSPAVVLIGLVASLICVGQWIVSLAQGAYPMTQAADKRQRVSVWVAMASLAMVVGTSPLSWPLIVVAAVKAGNGSLVAALYPVTVNGTAAAGALLLLLDAVEGRRFSLLHCSMLVGGLAFAAFMYIYSGDASSWGSYAVDGAPGVVTTMLPLVMLDRAHRARPRSGSVSGAG
jgi:hypothetical protein